ncbi:hypothetical protein ABAC460_16260 [Asticcacaulis sp. AC460]|uniref:J domain-containing protein n=1 Tax=Asticcacaulis sp. AC460 TaxID=1282360 RepID=UPI0003C3C998|nr:hypothetical protein [Asticcacaulis sp. AC460]ESQ88214.1 hypothetical protein ABAC460_16260 [Asticcacaulis sp. AC460]
MWIALGLAILAALIFLGRQVRLGKVQSGPWFKQFRVLRGVMSLGFLVLGVVLLVRGSVWAGLSCLATAIMFSSTVRFSANFQTRPQRPEAAAAYTAEQIQAYQTLGLAIGADRKAVVAAWKQLMKTAHPDQGGSADRAKALNAARDLLLKRR